MIPLLIFPAGLPVLENQKNNKYRDQNVYE